MSDEKSAVTRVIGIYNARGTLRGELSYLLQRTFAGKHCALCDITHGSVRRRPSWDRCVTSFSSDSGIIVDLLHLDEVPAELKQVTDFAVPAVYLQRTNNSFALALGPNELEMCGHSPEQLFTMLNQKLQDLS